MQTRMMGGIPAARMHQRMPERMLDGARNTQADRIEAGLRLRHWQAITKILAGQGNVVTAVVLRNLGSSYLGAAHATPKAEDVRPTWRSHPRTAGAGRCSPSRCRAASQPC